MSNDVFPPAARGPHNVMILIVEENKDIGEFLQKNIEEDTPYYTVIIHNSQTALEQAPLLQPALLLVDYQLPDSNGLELYDRLQEKEEIRGTPTIMISPTLPQEELARRGIYQLRRPMDIQGVVRMITHAFASFEEQRLQRHYL